MSVAVLVLLQSVSPVEPVEKLRLACTGAMADQETTAREGIDTNLAVSAPPAIDGTILIELEGENGRLTYPDGRQRELSGAFREGDKVSAGFKSLSAKFLVELDRRSGEVYVREVGLTRRGHISFRGTCRPTSPTAP
ncbi:MAG: hypothetical protein EON59_15675 [Alphaproteobacteria bacterium]|nr:MAG: hypothetical protein EON59_15675 [Alphaproteobacteria bacterium]